MSSFKAVPSPRRNALVTGGSGGIGQATTNQLRALGFGVSVIDLVAPATADHFFQCDLAEHDVERTALLSARRALGKIDTLVFCAGVYDASTLESCSLARFRLSMRVNVESCLAMIQAWLSDKPPEMGTVVLVASAAGHVGSRDPAYSASKAAMLGLGKSLALNLAPLGLAVFCVSPGVVDTPMSAAQGDRRRGEAVARTMLKRAADPEEVAATIAWLVETRPIYMSGADFNMSNGIAW